MERDVADTESSRACITDYARLLITERDPLKAFARYFSPGLIQHDPDIGDGHHGDEEFLEARRLGDPDAFLPTDRYATIMHSILADGDLVCLKSHVFISHDDPGRVFVDIWRIEEGRFAEHWSAIETIPARSPNPVPMWCGVGADYADALAAGDTVSAPVMGAVGDAALREASLATVRAYLDMIADPARVAQAVKTWMADDFVEYSPRLGQGRQALIDHLTACAGRGESFTEARFMADGDLVLFHGRAMTPEHELGYSQMHLFRVADGRINAHWGVRQAIPTYSVAGRCMVEGPLERGRVAGPPLEPVAHH